MNSTVRKILKDLFVKKTHSISNNIRSFSAKAKQRTHTCGQLCDSHIGQNVTLCGWLQYQRMNKFAILRDAYGTIQVIIPEQREDLINKLEESHLESVIRVRGTVQPRPASQQNSKIKSGKIEVVADDYEILNPVTQKLPFNITDYNKAKESLRMQYRYLDLRFPEMQKNLRLRSLLIHQMCDILIKEGFTQVETPTLFKRTPGGAREFLVPTNRRGEFYALTQSPQQLKQLLMIGGLDKYFQVARCYRNEGSRPDRQPEFTQMDIEMSFANSEHVMQTVEHLFSHSWPPELEKPSLPFSRITYREAIQKYGSDQPDLRYSTQINSIEHSFKAANFLSGNQGKYLLFSNCEGKFTSSFKRTVYEIQEKFCKDSRMVITDFTNDTGQLERMFGKVGVNYERLSVELNVQAGDLIVLAVSRKEDELLDMLGRVRTTLCPLLSRPIANKLNFVWVTDFPLFEQVDGKLQSMHHLFTQPHPEDVHLLQENPLQVRGLHYDLVLNGYEIAGGSVRIHQPALQQHIILLLELDGHGLEHMIEALSSGAPPHAGVAIGLDRYVALLAGAKSIRDVIAFPKTVEGRDLMVNCPCSVPEEDLASYYISVDNEDEKVKTVSN